MTGTTSNSKIPIDLENDAVTASTRTRKVIIVGSGRIGSPHILAAVERLKNLDKNVDVVIISPEQALERGITISSPELLSEPFLITNPYRDHMYTDYDGKYDRKGKKGYTRPYKYHK